MNVKPCLDPHAQTPQGKAANHIGLHCYGTETSCSVCNLSLFLEVLRNQDAGATLDKAYKDARKRQDYVLKDRQDKYDEREMHSSELTLNNKTKVR